MAQESSRPRFTIVNGPSKWDLMVSLFEGNANPRHYVTFRYGFVYTPGGIDGTMEAFVAITSVSQEDGSGESWMFAGYLQGVGKSIRGYYSSATRKGHFDYVS